MLCQRSLLITAFLATIVFAAATGNNHGTRQLTSNSFYRPRRYNNDDDIRYALLHQQQQPSITSSSSILMSIRGGDAISSATEEEEDNDEEARRKRKEEQIKLNKYRTEQQLLYQLRSTYLSEMLAGRGIPNLPTVTSVSTPEGAKPPEKVDWDCALSTYDDPKSCLYSFDAEPNTKVIAPINTNQWISLTALNRLRRTDPTKVEPMWHSQYAILNSWFSDSSEFSILQHVGMKGFIISSILLDRAMVLRSLLTLSVLSVLILFMPIIEIIIQRILVSAPFWSKWTTWGRIVRAGFPLKLLIGQLVWKGVASAFTKVENEVREYIVDLECEILEESVPVTVGVGVGALDDEDEIGDEFVSSDGEYESESVLGNESEEDEDDMVAASYSDIDIDQYDDEYDEDGYDDDDEY